MDVEAIRALRHTAVQGDAAALAALETEAAAGNLEALWCLGSLYDVMQTASIPVDLKRAHDYYLRAAEGGHAMAQFCLANLLDLGEGGTPDLVGARRWYLAAAEQDVRDAQMHVARLMQSGRGGPVDLHGAVEWYGRAVSQGDPLAATNLALIYLNHTNTQNFEAIHELLEFAADKLDGLAHFLLGELTRTGRGTDRDPELALLHYCTATLLLPPGDNQRASVQRMEALLAPDPSVRPEIERRARGYIERRGGRLRS